MGAMIVTAGICMWTLVTPYKHTQGLAQPGPGTWEMIACYTEACCIECLLTHLRAVNLVPHTHTHTRTHARTHARMCVMQPVPGSWEIVACSVEELEDFAAKVGRSLKAQDKDLSSKNGGGRSVRCYNELQPECPRQEPVKSGMEL
eukprot:1157732-Pelagomonas_calceolata.AAC.17